MAQKPSIPKGTRDFGPAEMAGRNYIFDTIRSVFKTYGYAPIETPSMENLSTLLGKYGEEGDKLLFRILNSGDAFSKINYDEYRVEGTEDGYNSKALSLKVCEKGLRYDLTVPFARFVCDNRNDGYAAGLIERNIRDFIERSLVRYGNRYVGIVGSLACACRDELETIGKQYGLEFVKFVKSPIDALVAYHLSK